MSSGSGTRLDDVTVKVIKLVSPDGSKVFYSTLDNNGEMLTSVVNPLTTYIPNVLNSGWVGTTPSAGSVAYTALQVAFDGNIGTTRTITSSPATTISSITLPSPNVLQFNWDTTGATATTNLLFNLSNSANTMTKTRILPVSLVIPTGPSTLSGLIGWWDASDNATVLTTGDVPATNGQDVLKWNDKSSAANHFNVVNVNSPQYATNSINAKNVIDFRSGSVVKSLRTTGNFTSVDGLSSTTVLWVATSEAPNFANDRNILGQGGSAGNNATNYIANSGSNNLSVNQLLTTTGAGFNAGPSTSGTNNIAFINGFTWNTNPAGRNGNSEAYYHDNTRFANRIGSGNSSGTAIGNPSNRGPLVLGAGTVDYTFPNLRWVGRVAEIVIYNRSISNSEYSDLETYFNNKWGLNLF